MKNHWIDLKKMIANNFLDTTGNRTYDMMHDVFIEHVPKWKRE